MKFQFFSIAAQMPEHEQEALNTFCAGHRVVAVEKNFVSHGTESFWSVCVTYHEGSDKPSSSSSSKRDRVDYREVLNEHDFALYAQLRDLRKSMAEQEGVPTYALFTNEQLANMVRQQVMTITALAEINGVGKARLEKYGDSFVNVLKQALADNPQ